jgi:hypothetical protein
MHRDCHLSEQINSYPTAFGRGTDTVTLIAHPLKFIFTSDKTF